MNGIERLDGALIKVRDILGRPEPGPREDPCPTPARSRRSLGGRDRTPGQLELGLAEDAPVRSVGSASERTVPAPTGDKEGPVSPRDPRHVRDPRALPVERCLRALGGDVWETFEYALRTELPVDRDAADFAVRALLCGPEAASDRSLPEVRAVRAAAFKVRREVHRLLGLLRFAPDPDGILTARCEPDSEILDLLEPAFRRRYGSEPFRIVDLRRGVVLETGRGSTGRGSTGRAGLPDPKKEVPGPADPEPVPGSEPDPVDLWRAYYRAAEDPVRRNPRLRLQFMPRRYWKHLPELDA